MRPEHPRWEAYEARFRALAFLADEAPVSHTPLDACQYYLCLYGDNGLPCEEEFALLAAMEPYAGSGLKKRTVQTGYWEDIVLFVP